jgi:aspartyl-tRNA(Asn)/glutamyl-tRNA(Gln) amidotransferase subunit A
MNTIEFIKKTSSGKIDIKDNFKKSLDEVKLIDKDYNYFLNYNKPEFKNIKKGKLYGLPISIKDCIIVKDLESKAGSKILEGYEPVFDATVIKKIKDEGGLILGKTSQDVFGFGSFNVNVGLGYKVPKNPYDKKRATGGSSGAAAGITQKIKSPHIAISESTGGSIAAPAAYCGVYGLTPTYGRVSRYGLMDYANSMDKIGVMGKDIDDVALMLKIISGYDERDSTSINIDVPDFTKKVYDKFKIAIINEGFSKEVQKEIKENVINKLTKYDQVSLPLGFKLGVQTYYLISMSEASTNLSKLCGMRYGKHEKLIGDFNEYFTNVRSKYFSKEAKRRIILGTFARMSGYRDAYYLKALKVRTKMINEYKELFKKYDLLITPTMPNIAPRFDEIEKLTPLQNYMMDIMTVGPNLCGLPHISIPSGFFNNMPTGMLVIADHNNEQKLIDYARGLK